MTREELDQLRDLANAASPGPWRAWGGPLVQSSGEAYVAYCGSSWKDGCVDDWHADDLGQADKDAAFIAACRTAVPQLVKLSSNLIRQFDHAVTYSEARQLWRDVYTYNLRKETEAYSREQADKAYNAYLERFKP